MYNQQLIEFIWKKVWRPGFCRSTRTEPGEAKPAFGRSAGGEYICTQTGFWVGWEGVQGVWGSREGDGQGRACEGRRLAGVELARCVELAKVAKRVRAGVVSTRCTERGGVIRGWWDDRASVYIHNKPQSQLQKTIHSG